MDCIINGKEILDCVEKFKKNKKSKTVNHEEYSFTITKCKGNDFIGFLTIYDLRGSIIASFEIKDDFNKENFCEELQSKLNITVSMLQSKIDLIRSLRFNFA